MDLSYEEAKLAHKPQVVVWFPDSMLSVQNPTNQGHSTVARLATVSCTWMS